MMLSEVRLMRVRAARHELSIHASQRAVKECADERTI